MDQGWAWLVGERLRFSHIASPSGLEFDLGICVACRPTLVIVRFPRKEHQHEALRQPTAPSTQYCHVDSGDHGRIGNIRRLPGMGRGLDESGPRATAGDGNLSIASWILQQCATPTNAAAGSWCYDELRTTGYRQFVCGATGELLGCWGGHLLRQRSIGSWVGDDASCRGPQGQLR